MVTERKQEIIAECCLETSWKETTRRDIDGRIIIIIIIILTLYKPAERKAGLRDHHDVCVFVYPHPFQFLN
jgi:hypothetical protein